ncbi:MAG: hypothetical protein PHI12_10865 [Dehalococcoidales bacterium]|nr:hypothetical protein [Dehalococcoidales bacterium]
MENVQAEKADNSANAFGLSDDKMQQLEREVAECFNRVSFENLSNTPDFILARVAISAALEFSKATLSRDAWWNRGRVVAKREGE